MITLRIPATATDARAARLPQALPCNSVFLVLRRRYVVSLINFFIYFPVIMATKGVRLRYYKSLYRWMDCQEMGREDSDSSSDLCTGNPRSRTDYRCLYWKESWHGHHPGHAAYYHTWRPRRLHVSPPALSSAINGQVLKCRSLVINIIAGELITPVRRTAVFGMLQGCFMLGNALGNICKSPSLNWASTMHDG